jgi:putative oxidoreductase
MFSGLVKNVVVPLLLRLGLAVVFIYHGYQKVGNSHLGSDWMPGPDAPSTVVQFLVAWGELIGGLALAVGFLTRLAALGIIAIMAGAIATIHFSHGFSSQNQGYEYNFVLIVMAACVVLGGPGPIAVDRVFRMRQRGTG